MNFENVKFYTYCRVGTEKQLYSISKQEKTNQEHIKTEVVKNEQN